MPRYKGVLMPYDSSEKRRIPAWTDRIFVCGALLLLVHTWGQGLD